MFEKRKKNQAQDRGYEAVLGEGLSFGAAEAYRLLRTNLSFSLPDQNGCKVIGVTSTLRGEGKSTTSVNLAYTMAQTGKRVLLLEADLRRPNAAERLGLCAVPGLTNLLTEQCKEKDALQPAKLGGKGTRQRKKGETESGKPDRPTGSDGNFWVITAGDIPPNPAELLNSERMCELVGKLSGSFDAIIVDLPPVSVVSDALIATRFLGGMVVVVRGGICHRVGLRETMRRLQFADCKVLGFVLTDADYRRRKYGYSRKYGDYYKSSYDAYGDSPSESRRSKAKAGAK